MKVWVSREKKSLTCSSHSAGPEPRERTSPALDSVYPWPTVSFVRTAAESTWRARLERVQHSTCICPRWFPRKCPRSSPHSPRRERVLQNSHACNQKQRY